MSEMTLAEAEAAIKKHDDLRAVCRDLGIRMCSVDSRLSMAKSGAVRAALLREKSELARTLSDIRPLRDRAGVDRQHADRIVRSVENAPQPAKPPELNDAQKQHLRMLMSRVRDERFRSVARLRITLEFVAIVEPMLRGGP